MPYVQLNTNVKLTDIQKDEILRRTAELILCIPPKTIERTMVELNDGRDMYFGCSKDGCMKVKVELFHESAFGLREEYAIELMKMISKVTDIATERIYLTYSTYDHWGNGGKLSN